MSNEADMAEAAEAHFRESALQAARSQTTITPDIDCSGCKPPHAKTCQEYRYCLEDWEKRTK